MGLAGYLAVTVVALVMAATHTSAGPPGLRVTAHDSGSGPGAGLVLGFVELEPVGPERAQASR